MLWEQARDAWATAKIQAEVGKTPCAINYVEIEHFHGEEVQIGDMTWDYAEAHTDVRIGYRLPVDGQDDLHRWWSGEFDFETLMAEILSVATTGKLP